MAKNFSQNKKGERIGQPLRPVKKARNILRPLIIVAIILVIILAVVAGIFMKYRNEQNQKVKVMFDPVIVSSTGETHLESPQVNIFDSSRNITDYKTSFDETLGYDQYFVYNCIIKNNRKANASYTFKLSYELKTNASVRYAINDEIEVDYEHSVTKNLEAGEKATIKLYVRSIETDANARIKANFDVLITEI